MNKVTTNVSSRPAKKYPTIGVCGLDCGLCTRFYTAGPSRCPGCAGPAFHEKHPTCSFITCCVRSKGFEVCSECPDFPCAKFRSQTEYDQMKESLSYPSYKKVLPNLYAIKEHGIKPFIEQQEKRIKLLEEMIKNFDDGRSKSYFCRAAIFTDSASLAASIENALRRIKAENIKQDDMKSKAKIIKSILNETL